VDRAHQAFDDAVLVIENFRDGGKAVGRAGGVGDLRLGQSETLGVALRLKRSTHDSVFGVVGIKIHTADKHGSIGRGCGDDNLLCTTFKMRGSPER
jgi:hypothetical protein